MIRPIVFLAITATLALSALAGGTAFAQNYHNRDYATPPSGSYNASCTTARSNGTTLQALCRNNAGQWNRTSIDIAMCRGTDIANVDGQLSCARQGGYGRGYGRHGDGRWTGGYTSYPSGSYQASCRDIRMNGSTLTATCGSNDGFWRRSYLDLSRCYRTDNIANINGQLRCAYRR